MTTLLLAVLVASLVGSLHCAGMCGGIVALCVGGRPVERRPWAASFAYHGGRLVSYVTLGVVSGAVGAAVDFGGASVGVSRAAAIAAGALMILFGAAVLLRAAGARLGCGGAPEWMRRFFGRGAALAGALPPARRALILGLLTAALPCGWLYAFVITAAGTGHALGGALVMVAFWAGTVPILLALGLSLDRLATPLRRHLPTVTAFALVLVGVATVAFRLSAPAYADMADGTDTQVLSADEQVAAVQDLDSGAMPCCHDDGK